ncbi:MAG: hypothetical protein JST46_08900 [Bacteroidetes bacterium]|nr:hypothetical protein [Bacteroidota bacterium]
MKPRGYLQLFILGDQDIPSLVEFKRAFLRGQLSVVCMFIGVFYASMDTLRNITINYPFQAGVFALGLITLILNRRRWFLAANFFFLTSLNLIIFAYCSSESFKTGSTTFFICACMTAFAMFNDRRYAIFFSLVSTAFFALSFWGSLQIVPYRDFSEEYIRVNFVYNFSCALISSILIIYFLISVNRQSESLILEQNQLLKKTNQELDQFVYSASHDLRAPLSTIRGLVQLYHISTDEKDREEIISKIRDRTEKMDDFISDILNYSRNSCSEVTYETIEILPLIRSGRKSLPYEACPSRYNHG